MFNSILESVCELAKTALKAATSKEAISIYREGSKSGLKYAAYSTGFYATSKITKKTIEKDKK